MSGNATVLMSGGLDSTVCAYFLKAQGYRVNGLFVDFGQRAALPEQRALTTLSQWLSIPLRVVRVEGAPEYGAGEIIGRNAFLVFTALLLRRTEPGLIVLGIHSGTPYYDCSKQFVGDLSGAISGRRSASLRAMPPRFSCQAAVALRKEMVQS